MRTLPALLCAVLIVVFAPACQGQGKIPPDQIVVQDAWVPEVPPVGTASAAFMKVENHSSINTAIVSVESDVARVSELHEMAEADGMMTMRKVQRIALPAHGVASLEPGGYHVMLIDLKRKLKVGDQVRIKLVFQDGSEKSVVAPVRKYDEGAQ